MTFYNLDENRNPIKVESILDWDTGANRIVRQTHIRNYFISTVFLGIDHSFSLSNLRPILFETMIMKDEGWENYQERYCTWKQAYQGHRNTVRMVINKIRNGE